MSLKFRRKTLLLFIIFFLADHCFWLVNANMQNIAYEVCCISIIVLFIISFIKKGFREVVSYSNYNYYKEVLFTIVMGIYSSVQSMILYGQSFKQGFLPQRFMITGFIIYFVINKYFNKKQYALESMKKMFLALGYCELVIYITQFVLINAFEFLHFQYKYRLGEVRMNMGTIALPFVIFNSINNLFKARKFIWKDALIIAAGFFYAFGIAKTRALLLAFAVAIVGGFLMWKTSVKKKIIGMVVVIVVMIAISQISLFSFLIEGLNGEDASSKTRTLGREYYLMKIVEHPIIGCGYINTENQKAVDYSGKDSLDYGQGIIAWVDLGFYGLTFFFGLIGFIWFLILYGRMTYQSFKVAKRGNLTYFMFMLYSITISPNGTGFLWSIGNAVSLALWMSMIEREYKNYYGNKTSVINQRLDKWKQKFLHAS